MRAPKVILQSFDVRAQVGTTVDRAIVLQKTTPFWI